MNEPLESRLIKAKQSDVEAERLLMDYLPFIKKKISSMHGSLIEYEDRLTVAMLAFLQGIRSYEEEKGSFIGYVSVLIQNRLIDEERKEGRYREKVVYLDTANENEETKTRSREDESAVDHYNISQQKAVLSSEIEIFSEELEEYHIAFSDLPSVCPKRKGPRELCMKIAYEVVKDTELYITLKKNKRLPQGDLIRAFDISVKILEKYRKYIIALVVLLKGDYPNIHTFIPKCREGSL